MTSGHDEDDARGEGGGEADQQADLGQRFALHLAAKVQERARQLAVGIPKLKFISVRREANLRADQLVNEALEEKALSQFQQYSYIRREVPRGRSRLDFLLSSRTSQCFVENRSLLPAAMGPVAATTSASSALR